MSIFEKRTNYKPFEYGDITNPLIEAMWASHWTHNEFSFQGDIQDYHTKLSVDEQGVLRRAILLISQIEVAVKSYWSGIGKLIPKPEIADMGAVFGGVEVIHSRAYAEILEKLGFNDDFQNLLSEEVISRRVAYLTKYLDKVYEDDKKNICYSLALFSIFTENVSLFSQFYTILGFNRFNNVLKDVANIVQYTSKEENLHAEGGMALLVQIRKEHPEIFDEEFIQKIQNECKEAYISEAFIINWVLGGFTNEFLSQELLMAYVGGRMNDSLTKIGIPPVIEVNQELLKQTVWMDEEVYASTLTYFFHKKPIDYTKKDRSYNLNDLF